MEKKSHTVAPVDKGYQMSLGKEGNPGLSPFQNGEREAIRPIPFKIE